MNIKRTVVNVASLACGLFVAHAALAGVHTWDVVEVFSNADGTIQYIELREMNGTNGEFNLNGQAVTSDSGGVFVFTANYPATTANKTILLATQACADLLALDPNNPLPDHIIDPNFFDPTGDTVFFGALDSYTFGAIPTDCINSMNDTLIAADNQIVAPSTPRNYALVQGAITRCGGTTPECLGDVTGDGQVNIDDYSEVILNWGTAGPDGDTNGDGDVDIDDYTDVVLNWDQCNPPK